MKIFTSVIVGYVAINSTVLIYQLIMITWKNTTLYSITPKPDRANHCLRFYVAYCLLLVTYPAGYLSDLYYNRLQCFRVRWLDKALNLCISASDNVYVLAYNYRDRRFRVYTCTIIERGRRKLKVRINGSDEVIKCASRRVSTTEAEASYLCQRLNGVIERHGN